jgi:dipeptidyl aminopeptidase/acylaminoacyl peptidase
MAGVLALAGLSFVLPSAHAAPADVPPALAIYGDLPGIEDMALSPSGKALAIIAPIKGERRLIVIDAERKPVASAPIGNTKLDYVRWADESHVIVSIHATVNLGPDFTQERVEMSRAVVVSVDKHTVAAAFDKAPNLVHATFGDYGTRVVNGRTFAYFGAIELVRSADRMTYQFDHGRPALYAIDIATGIAHRIATSAPEDHWRHWLVGADGEVAATLDYRRQSGNFTILDRAGRAIASGTSLQAEVGLIALAPDGKGVIYSIRDAQGTTRWYQQPFAGGPASDFLPGVEIERTFTDPQTEQLLGYLPKADATVPVMFDPASQAALRKVYRAFPGSDTRIEGFTPDIGHVLVRTSGGGDPGTWFTVDVASRKADPVGDERPLLPSAAVGPVSVVAYKAADGMAMDGVLTLPPASITGQKPQGLPAVMLPHGGPNAHDRADFDWWAQALASRGYAVFQPNFRGSTNRDNAFRDAGNGQWGRKMQTDVSDGLAELVRQGVVDPKRVCIVGASYGGYAALAGVTLQHGLYRCAVAVAGVSDLSEMYYTDIEQSGDDPLTKRQLRTSLGAPATFAEVSPRRHAAQADAPVLLIHGKDDTVVPFHHSDGMLAALRRAGKPVEMVTLANEDHWLSRAATRQQMLEACVKFVLEHNPPQRAAN